MICDDEEEEQEEQEEQEESEEKRKNKKRKKKKEPDDIDNGEVVDNSFKKSDRCSSFGCLIENREFPNSIV